MYQPQQDAIMQMGAQGINRAVRATGGDIGSTMMAIKSINRGTGRNLNELYGGMMNQSVNLLGQQASITDALAKQSFSVDMYEKQQAMADAHRSYQNAMQNIQGLVARGMLEDGTPIPARLDQLLKGIMDKLRRGDQLTPEEEQAVNMIGGSGDTQIV
jgi:hypothetical protein